MGFCVQCRRPRVNFTHHAREWRGDFTLMNKNFSISAYFPLAPPLLKVSYADRIHRMSDAAGSSDWKQKTTGKPNEKVLKESCLYAD